MAKFKYDGPVTSFGRVIQEQWEGYTIAESEKKAKNNLIFQFKKNNNMIAGSKVELPGDLMVV